VIGPPPLRPVTVERSSIGHPAHMRIVVTGASGNVGTAVLRHLKADGHGLVGVSRRAPDRTCEPFAGVDWACVDLAGPNAQQILNRVFAGADAVVHLAWGFQPSHDIDYLERIGVGGTRAVVRAAHAAAVPHLVHMSSLGAYSPGPDDRWIDESWPTEGVLSLPYSRHKVAAERLLDEHEREHPDAPVIARMRPALVLQRDNGSALLRYFLPSYVPAAVLGHLPVLPVDRRLTVPAVHTEDVADAVVRVLQRRSAGPFNLMAEPVLTRDGIARVLRARPLHVPRLLLRGLAWATWRAHVQPVDPGWLDLAFAMPPMDTSRARRELGWAPSIPADVALKQAVEGMAGAANLPSPALRDRDVRGELAALVTRGPIGRRNLP
jgi:UDP-glucose 4-epimerase